MSNKKYGADHFRDDEFECGCGCGFNEMDQETVDKLDLARDISGIPFVLESACRCKTYNLKVGGKKTSSHLKGFAVDISCLDDISRYKIVWSLLSVGFKRIGVGENFIHVDLDPSKPACIWTYYG